MALKFDSIGLAGFAVGVVQFMDSAVRWAPRNDSEVKEIPLESVLRASWAHIGKICHIRLFTKTGERHRFDGFRRADIDTLSPFFETKDIEFEKENVGSGGGNYGSLEFEDTAGMLSLSRANKAGNTQGIFEVNLGSVTQCVTPGHKQDELDIQFADVDSGSKEDQSLYSMRLWVPGQQAAEMQTRILSHAAGRSQAGAVLVEFDREQGNFVAPKNKYGIEMYATQLRMHGSTYDFKIAYDDISRFYMLERPRGRNDTASFFFVICLDKPVRQGQQKYPYLVWQTHNEEATIDLNLEESAIETRFPGGGLKPSMEGALHKLIAKIFKVLSGKTVFGASKRFLSAGESKCLTCNLGQRSGVLYPMDKSFLFLVTPVLVVEYSEVDFVEFKKEPNTRNFEFVVQLKKAGDGVAKKHQFGSIEKKEFRPLLDFVRLKEALFQVRNEEEEDVAEGGDDESSEDEDFNSNDDKAAGSGSSSGSDDSDGDGDDSDDSEREGGGGKAKTEREGDGGGKQKAAPKRKLESAETKAPKAASSPVKKKKAKKDPNAPKQAKSSYMFFAEAERETIKAENPEATFGELGKLTGAKWKTLSEEDKTSYNAQAAVAKDEYKVAMAAYVPPEPASGDDEAEEPAAGAKKKRKVKAKKDPNAPKKPLTGYFIFMATAREGVKAENPEASVGELGKLMGAKWKALSDEEKAPFNEKSEAAKEEYKVALAAYQAKASGGADAEAEEGSDSASRKMKDEDDDEEDEEEEDEDE
eukprot:CAMPEP_0171913252 /NCGR_PEP_ID=MMETSP0993-20121228/11615_1 /TAXON_ID=483369 /ORGANISM="non described non described, Strain CCMP2098" /LENGTH=754 /DNA_ID=CAMNT_0012547207 /DNA_START=29 /DNA_END=2293 /DNA_ORIENTATION=-